MSLLLRSRIKRTLSTGEGEPPKRDFPMIKRRIVENSKGSIYEEAKYEWDYTGLIQEEEVEKFTDQCELCNQRPLRVNFQITNESTKKSLLVGSTCIRRFLVLQGTATSAESWDYFVRETYKNVAKIEMKTIIDLLFDGTPKTKHIAQFRKMAEEVLGDLNNLEKDEKLNDFVDSLIKKGETDREKKIKILKNILLTPKDIISGLEAKELLPYVLEDVPEMKYIKAFRDRVKDILGNINSSLQVDPTIWNKFITDLLGEKNGNGWAKKLERIKMAIFFPNKIKTKRLRLETGQSAGHWANHGRRRARVETTLSKSEAYKNPQKIRK